MDQAIRQSIGIDCAKDELVVAFGIMEGDFGTRIVSNMAFPNNRKGHNALWHWARKLKLDGRPLPFVVEATGVYHEQAALFLYGKGAPVSVMLPNKVKHFAATLKTKTVTDKTAAQAIAVMGLEKKLEAWQPPADVFNRLKQLGRELEQLRHEMAVIKNQLHAERAGAWPNKGSIGRMEQRLRLITGQLADITREQETIVDEEPWLGEKIANICTIKGVGFATAVVVVAETNGFNLVKNKRQLVSYAGLDVVEKTSGTSVRGRTRISKKGNRYLRKALYFPAWSAIRHDGRMKGIYQKLESKHTVKMKAGVAVQRRLLELIYTLWKTGKPYDPNYEENRKKLGQPSKAALNEMAQGLS